MKKLFLLALLVSASVNALTFETPNEVGGYIVLTTRKGDECKAGMKLAYGTDNNGNVSFGCWGSIDNRIWITINGTVKVYESSVFVTKDDEKPSKVTKGM
jgi:hypothetical protein